LDEEKVVRLNPHVTKKFINKQKLERLKENKYGIGVKQTNLYKDLNKEKGVLNVVKISKS
jgi:hypothetical protein